MSIFLRDAGTAHAQNWLYIGTNYGTGGNWQGGAVPGAGATATFSSGGANQPIIAGTFTIGTVDMTAGSLTINATRQLTVQTAYNLTDASILGTGTLSLNVGSTLTAAGTAAMTIAPVIAGAGAASVSGSNVTFTGANSYSGTTTISAGVLSVGAGGTTGQLGTGAVIDNGSLLFNRSNAMTVANAISGTGTLTKLGAGTTSLTGANSYSGTTTISAGVLSVGAGGATGTLGTGDVVNNATLQINRTGTVTLSNNISGTGALTKSAAGTGILTGANSYSGTTTISAGTLQVGAGGATGTLGTGNVTNNAALSLNRSDAMTVANAISGTGTLTKLGAGTTSLTGANSYSGTTTISAGVLSVGAGGTTGQLGTGAVIDNGSLLFNRSNAMTVANAISGTGTLTKLGAGTTSLTGANSYSGTTTISAGVLSVGAGGATGTLGTGDVVNNATLQINRTGTVTLSNNISGTGALTKSAAGTGILTGANSYSGTTTISAGTLQVGAGGATGTLGTGNVTNNAALSLNRSDAMTVANAISGTGTLTKLGAGTTSLTGANSYSGTTTISAGTLQVGAGGATGTLGTGNVTNNAALSLNRSDAMTVANAISGTGTLTKLGAGTTSLTGANSYSGTTTISAGVLSVGAGGTTGQLGTGAVIDNGSLLFNRSNAMTVANAISGTGTLTKLGAGTTSLTGANSYSGTTTISAGVLSVGAGGATGTLGTGDVVNNATLQINRTGTVTLSNNISGTGALTKSAAGTGILTGANSYSGTTTISAGTLQVGAGGATGTLGTGNVTNNAALSLNRSDAMTVANAISGTGTLTKLGAGTTSLTGANSYSGTTTISAGTLQVGAGGATGTLGTGNVTNNAALSLNRSDAMTVANAISGTGTLTKLGAGTTSLTGANSYSGTTTISAGVLSVGAGGTTGQLGTGAVIDNGSLLFNRSNAMTVANAISGTGTLTKLGAGTTSLTGANSYSGTTTISAGVLSVGAGGATGTLGTGDVVNNATLQINRTGTVTLSNNISGTGALTKSAAGTGILTGANSYSGTTTISAGTLQVGAGGATGTLGTGNVTNNAALSLNRSDAMTVANAISGTGSVTQSGSGTTILAGVNTYAGPTTVLSGRLAVNGSITSNVTVGAGGNLGGSGTIFGSVTNNGTVAPGNSIGTLNINGSFTQAAGSTYQVEVNAAGQSDKINVTGAPGTATINGGTVQVAAASGTYAPRTTYTILTATGGVTGAYSSVTSNFAFLTPSLAYDSNNVYLTLLLGQNAFQFGGRTPNERAVGAALDQAYPTATGDFSTVLNAIAGLSTTEGWAALDAISGQQYSGFGTANIASGLMFMNVVGQQMAAARSRGGAGSRVALAQACEVACDDPEGREGPSPWSLWGSALGGTGSVAGNGNSSTLTYNAGGFATGVDFRADPRILIGFGLGYTSGNQWTNGFNSRGTSNSYQGSVYGSFTEAAFYVDALAGYGYNDNQMTRMIVIPGLQPRTAKGETGADQFLAQVEAGYKVGIYAPAAASLTPFARFQTSTVTQASFTETGAQSLNLNVAQQTTKSMRGTFGVELAGAVDAGWRDKLAVQLRLGWVHEYADTGRPVLATFAGAPAASFTVSGAAPQRDSAVVGFAANTAIAQSTSLYLRYDGEVGTGTDNHSISAGLRLSW